MEELVKKIIDGDKRSAARAITLIESNQLQQKNELLKLLYPYKGKAKTIGITGPPGAGKSSLVDVLIEEIRKDGQSVGVIAVDPSSPYTGGAILGDRVRMQRHAIDEKVFIRSMGTRGILGGLARATDDAVNVLEAMGLETIIIETVGVGQSELEIVNIADTTVLVLNPGAGDNVQAFKAGIMEAADIFVVNKSDLKGYQKLITEIEMLLSIAKSTNEWEKPIIKTISTEKKGIDRLWEQIQKHHQFYYHSDAYRKKLLDKTNKQIIAYLEDMFREQINEYLKSEQYNNLREEILRKEKNPYEVAEMFFKKIKINI